MRYQSDLLAGTIAGARAAARHLRRRSFPAIFAVVGLGIGVGALVALLALTRAVVLNSLPVIDPGQLYLFYGGTTTGVYSGQLIESKFFSYPFWRSLERTPPAGVDGLAAFRQGTDMGTFGIEAQGHQGPSARVSFELVAGSFFDVLGVEPASGRLLTPRDDVEGAPPAAVLSYPFWLSEFSRRNVVGSHIRVNGIGLTVVGVAAKGFFGLRVQPAPDVWVPLTMQAQLLKRESWLNSANIFWLNLVARVRDARRVPSVQSGINIDLHQFYLAGLGPRAMPRQARQITNARVQLTPGRGGISGIRYTYAQPLLLLDCLACATLLIACLNASGLLHLRDLTRRVELFTQRACGASPARLATEALGECLTYASVGGALAIGVAWGLCRLIVHLFSPAALVKVGPVGHLALLTLAASALSSAVISSRCVIQHTSTFRKGRDRVPHPSWLRAADLLTGSQIVASVALLGIAALLSHSLLVVATTPLGYSTNHIWAASTDATNSGYPVATAPALYQGLVARLSAAPGIAAVGLARFAPLSGSRSTSDASIEGGASKIDHLDSVAVAGKFFESLGVPLIRGQYIAGVAAAHGQAVADVSRSFVERYLPGREPIGQRFCFGPHFTPPGIEIVGVVGDVRYYSPMRAPVPMAYLSLYQSPSLKFSLLVKSAFPAYAPGLRRLVQGDLGALPLLRFESLAGLKDRTDEQERAAASFSLAFGLLAALLTAIGIYAIPSFEVATRLPELGVRMALGASAHSLVWLCLRRSAAIAAVALV